MVLMNLFTGNGDTDIENGLVDTVEEGEGRKNWESGMCKTDS